MSYLVTGAAGFIGFHTALALLKRGEEVVGIDNLNDYYAPQLKHDRLKLLEPHKGFHFHRIELADLAALRAGLKPYSIRRVIHLAAQAGVRYSIDHPDTYVTSNLVGHFNMLEYCRSCEGLEHLLYASSSSVYGGAAKVPSSETDRVDMPISLYAATKRSDELMSYAYAHLYHLPQTGLRFFTIYGPWGRPDMAPWLFTEAIIEGRPIRLFNHGKMRRDFTYIDDVVPAILAVADDAPLRTQTVPPHRIYNLGNNRPEDLMKMVETIERAVGKKAQYEMLPMQPGDVRVTAADITAVTHDFGFEPKTTIEIGLPRFVEWYKSYRGI